MFQKIIQDNLTKYNPANLKYLCQNKPNDVNLCNFTLVKASKIVVGGSERG